MLTALRDTVASFILRSKITYLTKVKKSTFDKKNKHLLFLAWWFPPEISGGVYRPLSIARAAVQEGWDVTIVCGPEPQEVSAAGQYLIDMLPKSVSLIRLNKSALRPSCRLSERVDGGFETALENVLSVIRKLKYRPTVVVASGPPFNNFVSAYYLSLHYQVPYALDYRDEWTDCPFDFVQAGKSDRRWEAVCLNGAARVIYTTSSFLNKARVSFPDLNCGKCRIFPNGFEVEDVEVKEYLKAVRGDHCVISFVGALSEHTPPDLFLEHLEMVLEEQPELRSKLTIQFIGYCNPAVDARLKSSQLVGLIKRVGQLAKPAAMLEMQRSSALLLLNPENLRRYIPGKFFDYMASGTPILVYGRGGEVSEIVQETAAGIVVGSSCQELAAALRVFCCQAGDSNFNNARRQQWVQEHDRGKIAKALLKDIERFIEE